LTIEYYGFTVKNLRTLGGCNLRLVFRILKLKTQAMKTLNFSMTLMLSISLFLPGICQEKQSTLLFNADSTENDSVEYMLQVDELGYETYLLSQSTMSFYSKEYYKNWNNLYVNEWNNRCRMGPNQELYDNEIYYDIFVDYGLELEYRLYYFFRFFENKYNVTLVQRGK
jgi:hypothetical protein